MGRFHRHDFLNYLENGIDTVGRELCYKKIKEAYDAEAFSREFKLDDKTCLKFKESYDSKYRVKIVPD